ncbi:uncharacterized protein LOC114329550 [Diabrotica virgifera virgifera]|uniref:Microtubule-associated protein Jupiter n=1 Tax=Diabrotica virgifera virgifera TaxID=50390 RepID=A0A6P7FHR2_DIAVI|nr:uncharacterized protein LOC114329550 [Diabrotica virgifera virgifera]
MTSTSFNIGLAEAKNSSRVLKPPGGGHTDIFGITGGSEITTPSKKKNVPPTTISSCFFQEDEKPRAIDQLDNLDNESNGQTNGNGNIIDENTAPAQEIKEDEKKNEAEPPRRVRVPPGGFSSGLW